MSQFVASLSGTGTAGTSTAAVVGENPGRRGITIVNDHASNVLYLQLCTSKGTAPTAVSGQGIRLNAAGGSWTSANAEVFKGSIAAIGSGASTNYTIAEW